MTPRELGEVLLKNAGKLRKGYTNRDSEHDLNNDKKILLDLGK